jgi:hypothetical protein
MMKHHRLEEATGGDVGACLQAIARAAGAAKIQTQGVGEYASGK